MSLCSKVSEALAYSYKLIAANYHINKILARDIILDCAQASHNTTELPKFTERLAMITGGTRGIGLEVVKMLLQCDISVILASKTRSEGEVARESLKESGLATDKVTIMILDNSSLESVRKFVKEFKSKYDKLDLLICNAGIFCPPYEETVDGFESQWVVNYLSHFLLTLLLVPSLEAGNNPRIVLTCSSAHEVGRICFDDINQKKNYIPLDSYSQSKLAVLMFVKKLEKIFRAGLIPITVNAAHPGIVNTNIFINCDNYIRYMKPLGKVLAKSPAQGAMCVVYLAVSPEVEGVSGRYYYNCKERKPDSRVKDIVDQDRLFEMSLEQVQLEFDY